MRVVTKFNIYTCIYILQNCKFATKISVYNIAIIGDTTFVHDEAFLKDFA